MSPQRPQSKAGNKQPLFMVLTDACFLQGGENMQVGGKKTNKISGAGLIPAPMNLSKLCFDPL